MMVVLGGFAHGANAHVSKSRYGAPGRGLCANDERACRVPRGSDDVMTYDLVGDS
jgi:hypothetical protein